MNKRETVIIISLIGLVVLLSWLNLSSSSRLNDKLAQMQGEINSLRSSVYNEMRSVSHTVAQIHEESRWWAPGETEILETGPDEASVKLGWYLREYRDGCTVLLNYRRRGNERYTTLEAEEGGSGGYFYAVLPIELSMEPAWYHYVSISGSAGSGWEERVEESDPYDHQLYYEYYISIEDQGTIRTGEVRSMDLYKLNHSLYSYLNSNLHIHDQTIHVHLSVGGYPEPRYTVTEACLESRKDGRLVERWPLEGVEWPVEEGAAREDSYAKNYNLQVNAEPGTDFNSLALVVTFSDGQSFIKETIF